MPPADERANRRRDAPGQIATARRGAETQQSIVGDDGRFFFENMPAGMWEVEVAWDGRTCRARLDAPDAPGAMRDAGIVLCR